MIQPGTRIEYESISDAPRRVGAGERMFRIGLSALGVIWFGFFLLVAVLGFWMRDLGNEPGSPPVTVRGALPFAIMTGLVGLPGVRRALSRPSDGRG
jgi:hypothetical protein